MCGIAGFAELNHDAEAAKGLVEKMSDLIVYRGPDGFGYYSDDQVALGHRRLSIIDLDAGQQPMYNEDGSIVVVFNGEIYNYQDLRAELLECGHTFATSSDTEVLLHGYEQWGSDLPNRLRGMFAFAIWDQNTKTLFGARDIFGIKPLYYYHEDGLFLFASEIKCFLAHPGFKKELNEQRLPEYLSIEYIPNSETMFKSVFKLPGAHSFTWHNDELTIQKYYDLQYHVDESKTLEQWEEEISKKFKESVAVHQIADVEVGCFLSSGVDSSYVVKEISKGTPRVKSFSVGYEEEKYSELPYAQEFSKHIGVTNISNKVNAEEFFEANRIIQWYLDEPMPNPSEVPLYYLAKNAREYVKVVLSGEGSDELFGGYPIYSQDVHYMDYEQKVPAPVRHALGAIASKLPNFHGKNFLVRGGKECWQRCRRANYVFPSPADRDQYLLKDYGNPAPEEFFKPWFDEVPELDAPTKLQYVDMHTWMIYDILLKADRMSMANSLELRVPFLDKEMLELALSIPQRYRSGKTETKIALRRAALKEMPEHVANREKLGFPVPLNDWLKQDKYYNLVREAFTGEIAQKFFKVDAICKLLDDHKAGVTTDSMTKIWSIYSFILWYDLYFVQEGVPEEVYNR